MRTTDCEFSMPNEVLSQFLLRPEVTYLNHGSFGATPSVVFEAQMQWQRALEAEPVQFLWGDLESRLRVVRERVGQFVRAHPDDLALVTNATTGVNTVLKSLRLKAGDELVATSHGYNACTNALRSVARRCGAHVKIASVPFPVVEENQVLDAVEACISSRTVLVLIDHVTSPTALIFPVEKIVKSCQARGILTLIDGAHAPGMCELDLNRLDADFYTGNLHKWVCAPKGAAFLHVKRQHQSWVEPLVVSHGANALRSDVSAFRLNFDWMGTADPSAFLSVPHALDAVATLHLQGWPGVVKANHELVLEGADIVKKALPPFVPVPERFLGSMAALALPFREGAAPSLPGGGEPDPLQRRLFQQFGIEVPVFAFEGQRLLRISAQRYNCRADYELLAEALRVVLS
jgi:isopenicillin-N epimerase